MMSSGAQHPLSVPAEDLTPRVCAVVVTYNRSASLKATLASLLEQTRCLDKVIVVDNASREDVGSLIAEAFPDVMCIRLPENLGYAAGLARGMRHAFGEGYAFFWLFDDDSRPDPEALRRCLEIARAHPHFGIVGMDGGYWKLGAPRYFQTLDRHERRRMRLGEQEADFVMVDGALVSRQAVESVGYPSQDFFMMMEDMDFSRRIKRSGLGVYVLEQDLIERDHLGSSHGDTAAWRGYYQTRNHLAMAIRARSPIDFIGWGMRQCRFVLGTAIRGNNRWLRIRLRLLGAWHGAIGKMGRTIEPPY